MFNHAPDDYDCPFCKIVKEIYDYYTVADDVVYRDENTTAFISSRWWNSSKAGVIVIPNKHFENLYDISDEAQCETQKTVKKIAIAVKETYKSDGISTRQHNEPAGDQDLWHYHVHVFPRYTNDNLYANNEDRRESKASERKVYANKLKDYFSRLEE